MNAQPAPDLEAFQEMAEAAYQALPDGFRRAAGRIVIHVQDFADADVLAELGIESAWHLTGLKDPFVSSKWGGNPEELAVIANLLKAQSDLAARVREGAYGTLPHQQFQEQEEGEEDAGGGQKAPGKGKNGGRRKPGKKEE